MKSLFHAVQYRALLQEFMRPIKAQIKSYPITFYNCNPDSNRYRVQNRW